MHTAEGHARYQSLEHSLLGSNNIHVLGTNHHVNSLVLLKAAIHAVKHVSRKFGTAILKHHTVHDIGFSDKVGNKGVHGLVVDIRGRTDLLDMTVFQNDHGI